MVRNLGRLAQTRIETTRKSRTNLSVVLVVVAPTWPTTTTREEPHLTALVNAVLEPSGSCCWLNARNARQLHLSILCSVLRGAALRVARFSATISRVDDGTRHATPRKCAPLRSAIANSECRNAAPPAPSPPPLIGRFVWRARVWCSSTLKVAVAAAHTRGDTAKETSAKCRCCCLCRAPPEQFARALNFENPVNFEAKCGH